MNIVAIICDVVLFGFTCLVLVTDGPPREAAYIVFTSWLLLTLVLNVVALSLMGATQGWLRPEVKSKALEELNSTNDRSTTNAVLRIAGIVCNLILLGFTCWAFVDQYPHPRESGFVPFVVMMVFTPILNGVALFRTRTGRLQSKLNV